ncbi:BirA family biotin operon repressor/biotin-[acetyl-CoA-carboxylase] ligase [Balneicella halophila]|uniref:BirA family biotin operon repressor/biotin-[acetyl-CoA-carboxylase] ligase n=1 Tax=Balneicella halophila TaxID=1537566 RepID=A0A7L4UMX0_BALHA|nr:biotin--[acetyl-CoA-carboxylase] ligase [Balneicella halophila]PVX49879.1 BirA family biotin operon repressor/biotin-[acetyl-CoA-carboxylase] ligase [Balneicella halophila]
MFELIKKEALASTNSYALELINKEEISEPTVVVAKNQLSGRGQAQNQWFSEKDKSLTFSIVLFPKNIKAERQFILSQCVCLALYDTLSKYVEGVSIKWPNDIYINGKKCCGILIENTVMGNGLAYSICGVGLNVNNSSFSVGYVATSLALEAGKTFDLDVIFQQLLMRFEYYYQKAEVGKNTFINTEYHNHLFRLGVQSSFEDKDGQFQAKVIGVDQYGQLLLEDSENQLRTYGFKEVMWLP